MRFPQKWFSAQDHLFGRHCHQAAGSRRGAHLFDLQVRRPAAAEALSFCLAEPAIAVVLIGTTNARHLHEAIRAVGSI